MMNFFKNKKSLMFINLKKILVVLFFVLISIVIVFAIYYNSSSNNTLNNIATQTVSVAKNNFESIYASEKYAVDIMNSNSFVADFMFGDLYKSRFDANNITRNVNILTNTIISNNPIISSIYIYSDKNEFVITNTQCQTKESFFDKESISFQKGTYMRRNISGVSEVITSVREYVALGKTVGKIIINYSLSNMNKLFNEKIKNYDNDVYIVDNNGKIFYSNNNQFIAKNISEIPFINNNIISEANIQPKHYQKSGLHIFSQKSDQHNILSLSTINKATVDSANFILFLFTVIFIILNFCIIIFGAFFIAKKTYEPIAEIVNAIDLDKTLQTVEQNELKIILNSISVREKDFSKLKSNLIENVYLLKQFESFALQNQINPHFLYNTLETINLRAMVLLKGKNEISTNINKLTNLLRYCTPTNLHLANVADEVSHSKIYLDIMKSRCKDKFNVTWDVDDKLLNEKILRLTLQPLLENSIYHGIKPLVGRVGEIKVAILRENDTILISVTDNGVGIELDRVKKIKKSINELFVDNVEHIGLHNVNRRIKLMFGEEYGINIESQLNSYTKISILIKL